jgi:hypothetical protein
VCGEFCFGQGSVLLEGHPLPQLSKWFYDTSTDAATGAARCGSLLKSDLVSWSLTIDERSGHEDLYGSSHRSVISYIHGITGLYCSSLPCLCEPEPFSSDRLTSVKWRMLGLVACHPTLGQWYGVVSLRH